MLLAPKITRANAADLIARFERKTVFEIKLLLAELFPGIDTPTSIRPIAASGVAATLSAAVENAKSLVASAATSCAEPQDLNPVFDISNVAPLSPGKLKLETTITQELHAKLEYARNLLGHRLPSVDLAALLDRALTSLIRELEKRKFAAIRLRCRAHNQLEAERTYGAEFMQRKREEAQRATGENDVVPWLRKLKCSLPDARRIAELVDRTLPDGSVEERVRLALRQLGPKVAHVPAPAS